MLTRLTAFLLAPVRDYQAALLHAMPDRISLVGVVRIVLAAGLGWWLYVPLHELLHALGCLAAGGSVSKLEIAQGYGGSFLQPIFPWVSVGSEYAGRLSGFDTHGSDFTYLVTVLAPFGLTLWPGVPLLRAAGGQGRGAFARPAARQIALGASLAAAYAPFLSVTGDFFETASIVLTHSWASADQQARWRSDDVFKLFDQLFATGYASADVLLFASGLGLSIVLALATYAVAQRVPLWWHKTS